MTKVQREFLDLAYKASTCFLGELERKLRPGQLYGYLTTKDQREILSDLKSEDAQVALRPDLYIDHRIR